MESISTFKRIFVLAALAVATAGAQSLKRPVIYATAEQRQEILDKIADHAWASGLVTSMKKNVDPKLAIHLKDPDSIFSSVKFLPADDGNPESYGSPYASSHGKVLSTAAYAAMLHYVTQEAKYADFSAAILTYYFEALGSRTEAKTTITGNYFYDPRTVYPQLAVAYDFLHGYLRQSGRTVYSKAAGKKVAYNHQLAQKVLRNIAARALNEAGGLDQQGRIVSNHPILTAPGSLFAILCIDDDQERERLFDLFWDRGTKRQASFTKTILPMFTEQALWPESVSYGFMPNVSLILNLVDILKPGLNAGPKNRRLFESASLLENLRLPHGPFVRYGDSHRKLDGTDELNQYALSFAKRRGYAAIQKAAEASLKQKFPQTNGYSTSVPSGGFENYSALQLFWGIPLPTASVPAFDYKTTVVIPHAGVALQRNLPSRNAKEYGLVGIIGGAHYVHAHLTGITMELYGSGDVMVPNGGLPPSLAERQTLPFQGHLNRHAGNNTVIVNGSSKGASRPGAWGNDKLLYQDAAVSVAAEPAHLKAPISEDFSFATQRLDDGVNRATQERTLSIVRTSPSTGYYVDLFRSKSLNSNRFHDYIYHNLGDTTTIASMSGVVRSGSPTAKYKTDIGDEFKSPGWRLFENTVSTASIPEALRIRFSLAATKRYMHMLVPGGVAREYTRATGPATYEALNGYEKKPTQVLAIRQDGEAWDRPFAAVLEPSASATSSVRKVENLYSGTRIVGVKVQSMVGDTQVVDHIISNNLKDGTYSSTSPAFQFKGRFGIYREKAGQATLYIGDGLEMKAGSVVLTADSSRKALRVVKTPTGPVGIESAPKVARTQLLVRKTFSGTRLVVDGPSEGVVRVYGGSGSPLVTSDRKEVDLSHLPHGVYLVAYIAQGESISQKILVGR